MIKSFRKKTLIILIIISMVMFSPIAQNILIGFRNPFFQNLGFTKESLAPWFVWILALSIAVGYVLYTFKAIPTVKKMQKEISMFKLVGLFAGLVAGIIEELLFRRWLMDSAMNHGTGIIPQIILSGVAFGFFHIGWGMFGRNRKFGLRAGLATTILGFSLAIIYVLGQRNIGPCIVAHCLISMIIEPWLLLAAVSG